MDDEGKTISNIDIDTEAYTGEAPFCSENSPLGGAQTGDTHRGGLPRATDTGPWLWQPGSTLTPLPKPPSTVSPA